MVVGLAVALAGLLLVATASANPARITTGPESHGELTAGQIYQRILANRLTASIQELTLVSARAGRIQPLRVQMLWRRYAEDSKEGRAGIRSRTVVRYLSPSDVRHTGYLVVDRREGPDDQFIYLPSMRRIRRVNLREVTLAGTDLSVGDVVPRELDHATYRRDADRFVGATRCYVVEATPKEERSSAYSRFLLYVDKLRYVPLRIRYWDRAGVEVKELRAPSDSIREIDGHFFPVRAVMRHLIDETYTVLHLDLMVANPELPSRYFSQKQLLTNRLSVPKHPIGGIRRY